MGKTKYKFDYIFLLNRWRQPKYARNSDWLIFGVYKWYSGYDSYAYMFSFFGFEIRFWFKLKEN